MARLKNLLAALLALLLLAPLAQALEVPLLAGRINDTAHIMRAETVQALTEKLAALEAENSVQIVVLTIPSLQGENLEAFALKTASTWQIGQKGKDNGALLLVAVKEREIRIETGYGLEGGLTDLTAGRIIRNEIIPQFRSGDYDGGIAKGVDAMMAAARGQYEGESGSGTSVDDKTLNESVGVLGFLTLMAGLFGRRKFWHALLAGAAAGTLTWLMYADAGLEPWGFLFLGVFGALCITWIIGYFTDMGSGGGGGSGFSNSGFSSGRSGGFSGGGGFRGGGGSFGGGGASGKW